MQIKTLDRPFELKALSEEGVFEGYGSTFGNVDSYDDIVAPGAFKATLREFKKANKMPAMLWQHKSDEPIGVWTSMKEDDSGLYVAGQLAVKTPQGATAYELMKLGAVGGMSIGYKTKQSIWDDKKKIRTLTELELMEVSVVTFPANTSAMIASVKGQEAISEIEAIKSESDAEDILRDAGFSRQAAMAFLSRHRAITQSDSGEGHKDDLAAHCYALANRMLIGR
tara:strand:- start:1709 stop:2383 length:675 start_codon:yes stop_codon:yes gene_type:complete